MSDRSGSPDKSSQPATSPRPPASPSYLSRASPQPGSSPSQIADDASTQNVRTVSIVTPRPDDTLPISHHSSLSDPTAVEVDAALDACNGFGWYQWKALVFIGATWYTAGFFTCCQMYVMRPPDEVCVLMNGATEPVCHEGLPTQEECDGGKVVSLEGGSMVGHQNRKFEK